MINTVWGSTNKPISSRRLAETLGAITDIDGTLYIGYPIIGTPEGPFPIDALLVSQSKGLVLFQVIEGRELLDYPNAQDEAANKVQSRLFQHPALTRRRKLLFDISTITFAPAIQNTDVQSIEDYPLCDASNLNSAIEQLPDIDPAIFPALLSVIQAISTLRRGRRKRDLQSTTSRGAKAKALEDSIANLDTQQSAAVIETFPGVQRIRGLAGCGKTIVLALKVAYLHAQNPEWRIAVTFNTRSLKKQFEHLINTFVLEQTNEEPDWDKVRIINAWGAPGGAERTGIYYEFCLDHGVEYLDFRSAKDRFGSARSFESVCNLALTGAKEFRPKYDAILIDEAQDFAPNFLLLCYEYLKDPKRLVYAYDELQNLGTHSLPPAEEIFGKREDGKPRVEIRQAEDGQPKQDIILGTCYRNSRPVLSTAHALGFGIYRKGGLVQIFENKDLWFDIGYESTADIIEDNEEITLSRTPISSPGFLEQHSSIDDLIIFKDFESEEAQAKWLADEIAKNIQEDELLPDDIVVINPDPFTTREAVGLPRKLLLQQGINSNLAGVTTIADVFTEPGTVTFTGIYRAKGNEAPMVYVINAHSCVGHLLPGDMAIARNRLFTAITRSKAWVRVLGVGKKMTSLISEFQNVKDERFALRFRYPTEEERKTMRTVNRDTSQAERERSTRRRQNLLDIIESLDSGESVLEDYPEELMHRLEAYFEKREKRNRKKA